jgi:hypothetical protein
MRVSGRPLARTISKRKSHLVAFTLPLTISIINGFNNTADIDNNYSVIVLLLTKYNISIFTFFVNVVLICFNIFFFVHVMQRRY